MDVTLEDTSEPDDDLYPYKPRGYPPPWRSTRWSGFGLHFIDGFRHEYLLPIKQSLEGRPLARRVLLFTTPLMKPLLLQSLAMVAGVPEYSFPQDRELRVTIAPQLFWGGNIMIGDIQPVHDYIAHLRTLRQHGYVPDLALIPRSFLNRWGQDVLGNTYLKIERETGVAVELLPVPTMMR
jgi:hypothetical protein